MKLLKISVASLAFCLLTSGLQLASAATISFVGRTEISGSDPEFNLTALGDVDWAYWSTSASSGAGVATNDMNGGVGIGEISVFGTGTSVRGSSTGTDVDFLFSNGDAISSGSANSVSGVFSNKLATAGEGVQLDFTLANAGEVYAINVWTAAYATQFGTVVGSIPGATEYNSGSTGRSDTTNNYYGDYNTPKDSFLYTFNVVADNPNDVFNFSVKGTGTLGASSHVIISGASISAIPEPSSLALLAGALVLGFAMLRRR